MENFKSTNSLDFYSRPWWVSPNDMTEFQIGTCEGIYRINGKSYEIVAICNHKPGNGHLTDVFEWFENACKRDKWSLKVIEFTNHKFRNHLIEKRGFLPKGKNVIKKKFN